MILIRSASDRSHRRNRGRESWLTFYPQDRADPLAGRFGQLESLSEIHIPPGAEPSGTAHHDVEIVTYVREGALAFSDGVGHSGIIQAGEFQLTTAAGAIRRREANVSRSGWARFFQLLLLPSEPGPAPGQTLKRFSAAERRGRLCVIASGDARAGSLHLDQDVLVFSALLDPGQHVVHELSRTRQAWLHLVQGEANLGDVVLGDGDGVGVRGERALSITGARADRVPVGRPSTQLEH